MLMLLPRKNHRILKLAAGVDGKSGSNSNEKKYTHTTPNIRNDDKTIIIPPTNQMLIHRHTHKKYNTRNRRDNTILLLIIILIIIRRIHNYNNSNTNTCQTQLWPLPALTTSSIARRTAGPTTDQARTCFSACAAALASASSRACAHTDSHTTESRAQCT